MRTSQQSAMASTLATSSVLTTPSGPALSTVTASTESRIAVRVTGVDKGFGTTPVLADLSLEISQGSFVSVIGPSGCGKTTFLRILGGLTDADRGEVTVGGEPVNGPPPGCVYVFQDYRSSLFGWRNVLRNVAFPLEGRFPKRERLERAHHYLEVVGLTDAARKYPRELSGGMQQRVAIARALAIEAPVMLFDEPFGAVDAQTRMALQDELLQLCTSLGKTVVFVTHDIDEAAYLSDRVVVLRAPGEVVDVSVGLEQPRDQVSTKSDPRFLELRRRLLHLLAIDGASEMVA